MQLGDDLIGLWFDLGLPDYTDDGKFDRIDYHENWSMFASEAGVAISKDGTMISSNLFDDKGVEEFEGKFNADFGMDEGTITVEMSMEVNNQFSEDFSVQFQEDNQIGFNIGYTVSGDMDQCMKYQEALESGVPMKGKKCVVEMEMDYESLQYGEGNMAMNLKMLPVKLALEITLPNDDSHTVVLRGEEKNFRKPELLSVANWYGIYYHEGLNTRKAFKADSQLLVARWPGTPQWDEVLIPYLEEKFEPHGIFFKKVFESFDNLFMGESSKLGHFIFYFDQFTATLKDEFDLSKFMKLSRFNTGLLSVFVVEEDFNSLAQDFLKQANNDIVAFLQCEDMSNFYNDMRPYVKKLASNDGKKEFRAYWIDELATSLDA